MNGETAPAVKSGSFWPLFLLELSFLILLVWQLSAAFRQRAALREVVGQQGVAAGQAAQVEATFRAMMAELVGLSEGDADARAIVVKYRISFNPAPPSGGPAEAGTNGANDLSK